mmetsp:Transcript_11853/g.31992  ORF Transcript_11853/g.31992 Transcript_11853/m.31992 type:complete len:312 (-) Transcript_11853:28-963(-)
MSYFILFEMSVPAVVGTLEGVVEEHELVEMVIALAGFQVVDPANVRQAACNDALLVLMDALDQLLETREVDLVPSIGNAPKRLAENPFHFMEARWVEVASAKPFEDLLALLLVQEARIILIVVPELVVKRFCPQLAQQLPHPWDELATEREEVYIRHDRDLATYSLHVPPLYVGVRREAEICETALQIALIKGPRFNCSVFLERIAQEFFFFLGFVVKLLATGGHQALQPALLHTLVPEVVERAQALLARDHMGQSIQYGATVAMSTCSQCSGNDVAICCRAANVAVARILLALAVNQVTICSRTGGNVRE